MFRSTGKPHTILQNCTMRLACQQHAVCVGNAMEAVGHWWRANSIPSCILHNSMEDELLPAIFRWSDTNQDTLTRWYGYENWLSCQSFLFQVGDQKFSAHRIVLAATIPYFQAMFTHDMMESKQDEINMKGIDARYGSLWYYKILYLVWEEI